MGNPIRGTPQYKKKLMNNMFRRRRQAAARKRAKLKAVVNRAVNLALRAVRLDLEQAVIKNNEKMRTINTLKKRIQSLQAENSRLKDGINV